MANSTYVPTFWAWGGARGAGGSRQEQLAFRNISKGIMAGWHWARHMENEVWW